MRCFKGFRRIFVEKNMKCYRNINRNITERCVMKILNKETLLCNTCGQEWDIINNKKVFEYIKQHKTLK